MRIVYEKLDNDLSFGHHPIHFPREFTVIFNKFGKKIESSFIRLETKNKSYPSIHLINNENDRPFEHSTNKGNENDVNDRIFIRQFIIPNFY